MVDRNGRERHTDVVVVLKEYFNKFTNIGMFQLLHDADFSSKSTASCMAVFSVVSKVFISVDHFHSMPFSSGARHSLTDCGKGSFTQLGAEVIMCIEAFGLRTTCCMTIHKA